MDHIINSYNFYLFIKQMYLRSLLTNYYVVDRFIIYQYATSLGRNM